MATKTGSEAPGFRPENVRSWMLRNARGAWDSRTNEVSATQLAEDAARAFRQDMVGGPLDDETHWIWEVAVRVSETMIIRDSGIFTSRR